MEIALSIIGSGVTFLAVAVTYLAWRNRKITRENTLKIVEEMRKGFERTHEEIKMGFEKMEKEFERIHTEIKIGFEGMHEDLKLIALLILEETKEEKEKLAKKILRE
ncbi:MAG: hypothetical protein ABDH37_05250 [Candidatus Hydrothermales bacterium]